MEKGNMSSKQLNFFITPEDYKRINEFILRKEAVILLNDKITQDDQIEFQNRIPNNEIIQIYLSNNRFIKNIKIKTTPKKSIKYFGIEESFLLEFDAGGFYSDDKTTLQRGRFYYVKSFWNNQDILKKKSDEFILWCNDFIKDFRKEFLKKYSKENVFLYSDSAIKWIEENNAHLLGGGQQWKKEI